MAKNKNENMEVDVDEDDIIKVKKIITIVDGKHKGHIGNMIRETRKDFDYIDIYINLDDMDSDVTIKTGFPCSISEVSGFGKLLIAAGIDFVPEQDLSLTDIKNRLIGRTVEFTTFTEESGFARIINKTIKFLD